jgi:hypothetical protein
MEKRSLGAQGILPDFRIEHVSSRKILFIFLFTN